MMNQLLMQMIAARTGAGANPALADLLARMRSGDSGSALNIEDLLAQQAQTNPIAAMLAKQLAEQKAMRATQESSPVIDVEPSTEIDADGIGENGGQGEDAATALCELRENMKGMLAELELLRERSDALAAAVGACCLCWGQNLECRGCRGRGGPGFCMPDEALFEEFVLPAVRTLRAQRAKNKNYSPQVQASFISSKNQ
jgi:hypothetical protein